MSKIDLHHWKDRASLPLPRAGCAAGLSAGKLVAAGGTYWREGRKFWCNRVDCFDPRTNEWEAGAPMPKPRGDAAFLVDHDILYILGGGTGAETETSVWYFQRGTWGQVPRLTLPAPRRTAAAVVMEGTFYFVGGLSGPWNDFASATTTLWAAAPESGWEPRASIPGTARFNCAVASIGGRMIMVGGCTLEEGKVRNLDEILAYDPRADQWSEVGRLPFAFRGACPVVDGDRLLLIGGYTDKFERGILSLDPQTGRVSAVGHLPTGLADSRFFHLGSRLLGFSGENGVRMRFPSVLEATLMSK